MTTEGMRVLEAIAWSERTTPIHCLPLRRIATVALGGNADLARSVLEDLDQRGFVHDNTGHLDSGWLTTKGRSCVIRTQ
jgi:hypothetical protein